MAVETGLGDVRAAALDSLARVDPDRDSHPARAASQAVANAAYVLREAG